MRAAFRTRCISHALLPPFSTLFLLTTRIGRGFQQDNAPIPATVASDKLARKKAGARYPSSSAVTPDCDSSLVRLRMPHHLALRGLALIAKCMHAV